MSVEDKIKELLEASMQEASAPGKGGGKADAMPKIDADADGKVDDTGAAVVSPDDKNGPAEVTKKVKKAAVPGGEANKGEQSVKPGATKVKEEDEADEDLEVVAEEEVAEGELPDALKKAIAKKKGEKEDVKEEDDEEEASDDDDEEDDDDMEEMKKMKEKLHAQIDKMKEMKHMKASYGYMKSSYKMKEDVDMSDDVNALTEGGEFDEEFKAKAKVVFEAAVNSKVGDKIVELEEHYTNQIDEETAKIAEELTDKVDTYLSYVVEQWTNDNELAVERGLKSEITEDFIVSLKKVFEEHYIDVPEDKYDVMAEQQDKISELEGKLNEQIEKNAETSKIVNEAKKAVKIEESAKDLTDTQKEKFMSLVEGVAFSDEDSFSQELETLKESYFPKVAKPIEEDEVAVEEVAEAVNLTSEMKDYVSAISRTLGK
tara:strand:+ start:2242 stop:3531 length:1290 start_codon:yes stop_codon:yes gene_type:complete